MTRYVEITGITDTNVQITLEYLDGHPLLKGMPISRILLCVMACSTKTDAELARVASALCCTKIGTDGLPAPVEKGDE